MAGWFRDWWKGFVGRTFMGLGANGCDVFSATESGHLFSQNMQNLIVSSFRAFLAYRFRERASSIFQSQVCLSHATFQGV
jgi:hypothetical protein